MRGTGITSRVTPALAFPAWNAAPGPAGGFLVQRTPHRTARRDPDGLEAQSGSDLQPS